MKDLSDVPTEVLEQLQRGDFVTDALVETVVRFGQEYGPVQRPYLVGMTAQLLLEEHSPEEIIVVAALALNRLAEIRSASPRPSGQPGG